MILSLSGTVFEKGSGYLGVSDSCGVGYKVLVPEESKLWMSAEVGAEISLFTSQQFRENEQSLYGFLSPEARNFFELLITVSGVGPKLGSTLLAHLDRKQLAEMILNEDIAGISAVPGIGKKMAERLIVELRDKVFGEPTERQEVAGPDMSEEMEFLSQALERLGFSGKERQDMLKGAGEFLVEGSSVEDVLRKLLSGNEDV